MAEYGAAIQLTHAAPRSGLTAPAAMGSTAAPTPPGLLDSCCWRKRLLQDGEAAKQRLQQASVLAVAAQAVERLRRACRQAARM